jgi:hypothetical protein
MLNLFLDKELLVQEIAELSRTFNVKLFSAIAVTAASYRVYGSLENMLNTALLKPLFNFDVSSASLLYVLIRMPLTLKDKLPRVKIELEITDWFKKRTNLQSIHITEPIYTEDASDRIDAVLLIGGFDTTQMFAELEEKVKALKSNAVEKGLITEDWQLPFKVEEEPQPPEIPPPTEIVTEESPQTPEQTQTPEVPTPAIIEETHQSLEQPQVPEPPQPVEEPKAIIETQAPMEAAAAPVNIEEVTIKKEPIDTQETAAPTQPAQEAKPEKPKRTRKPKKTEPQPAPEPVEIPQTEKPKRSRRAKKAPTEEKIE